MKFGVQLYGPLNCMQGDVMEKLCALAQAGVTEIEPCIAANAVPGMEGVFWPTDPSGISGEAALVYPGQR